MHLVRNPNFVEWSHAAQPAGVPGGDRHPVRPRRGSGDRRRGAGSGRRAARHPPADRMQEIRTRYAAQSHPYIQLALDYFFLNTRVAPFDDPDVRRALNYAVDRATMAELVGPLGLWGAGGPVTCQALPPNTPGYAPYCPFTSNGSSNGDPDLVEAQQPRRCVRHEARAHHGVVSAGVRPRLAIRRLRPQRSRLPGRCRDTRATTPPRTSRTSATPRTARRSAPWAG